MTPQQFAQLLNDLIARRVLTRPEAANLMQRFLDGEFAPDDLPLPPAEAQAPVDVNDAAVFAFLLLALGLSSVPRRRLRQSQRAQLRRRLRDEYDREMRSIAGFIVDGGSIREAHERMKDRTTQYAARMYTAGRGQASGARAFVGGVMAAELAWMYRFFGEIALRRLINRAYSVEFISSRERMYGHTAWAAWFQGEEDITSGSYGYVAVYNARDDGGTCDRCTAADRVKYYLLTEGPMPGTVCRAKGLCRCERVTEYNPREYERLIGQGPRQITVPQQTQRQRQAA